LYSVGGFNSNPSKVDIYCVCSRTSNHVPKTLNSLINNSMRTQEATLDNKNKTEN